MMLLVNNLHEKRITEGQDGRNIGSACAFILVATLHSCHMKNTIVFSQSDACDFLSFILSFNERNLQKC